MHLKDFQLSNNLFDYKNLTDKIEKIIDRILKNKADAKTAHLKTDKDMESSDKLTTKLKDTPALKEKKK